MVTILRNVAAHIANHIFRCFVALNKEFHSLDKAFIMELHQVLQLFHLFDNILSEEL